MENKTEKLPDDLTKSLIEMHTKVNTITNEIGKLHIKRMTLDDDLKKTDEQLEQYESEYKIINSRLTRTLKDLEDTYKHGSIDLQSGTITYKSD